MFLFVGQILPHKRPDWLLSAYHALVTYLEPGAHLVLVGMDRLMSYRQALDVYIAELNLHGAHMVGRVSEESLAAWRIRTRDSCATGEAESITPTARTW